MAEQRTRSQFRGPVLDVNWRRVWVSAGTGIAAGYAVCGLLVFGLGLHFNSWIVASFTSTVACLVALGIVFAMPDAPVSEEP